MRTRWMLLAGMLGVSSCGQDAQNVPGNTADEAAFSAIAADETIRLTGTEPFWGGSVEGDRLIYTTPENPDGTVIDITRFAGRGGLSFSGTLSGQPLDLAITPAPTFAPCSDGMSDRDYPFIATLRIGAETREGCAWTGDAETEEAETATDRMQPAATTNQ